MQGRRRHAHESLTPVSSVGTGALRVEARDKIVGKAVYIDDLSFPGMLHARIVTSPVAHGRLRGIGAAAGSEAVRIVTAADIPGANKIGVVVDDQPLLAHSVVRHIGEPIAIALAESRDGAERAARGVKPLIDPLPAVFEPEAALEAGAPRIHPDGNLVCHYKIRNGDVDRAFKKAAHVVTARLEVKHQEQMYMEGQGAIAVPTADGGVTVYASMQCPFYMTGGLSRALGIPIAKTRAIQTVTGGAFGGKEDVPTEYGVKAAVCALATGRPVKLVLSREEDLEMTSKRHPMVMYYRLALDAKGVFLGLTCDAYGNSGAYTTLSTVVLFRSSVHFAGPYRIGAVSGDIRGVYTNTVPNGAFRGFGTPQVIFGVESLVDQAAREMGFDPLELRERNGLRLGDRTPNGHKLAESVGYLETIAAAKKGSGWTRRRAEIEKENAAIAAAKTRGPGVAKLRGLGAASCLYGMNLGAKGWFMDRAGAHMMVHKDGSVAVAVGNTEMGQGATTVLSQIAADGLGCAIERIRIDPVDTALVPDSGPTVASRTTVMSGNAILDAARKIRARMTEVAARALGVKPASVDLSRDAARVRGSRRKPIGWTELAALAATSNVFLAEMGGFVSPKCDYDMERGMGEPYYVYSYATQIAEVTVDAETGHVEIVEAWCAHDSGRAINPDLFAGQVEGGFVQGSGWAVTENMVLDAGKIRTNNFTTYIIPGALDVPRVRTYIVEALSKDGPFGAKGVGEPSLMPAAAAVANAVAHALGETVANLPVLPEWIHERLTASRNRPKGGKSK